MNSKPKFVRQYGVVEPLAKNGTVGRIHQIPLNTSPFKCCKNDVYVVAFGTMQYCKDCFLKSLVAHYGHCPLKFLKNIENSIVFTTQPSRDEMAEIKFDASQNYISNFAANLTAIEELVKSDLKTNFVLNVEQASMHLCQRKKQILDLKAHFFSIFEGITFEGTCPFLLFETTFNMIFLHLIQLAKKTFEEAEILFPNNCEPHVCVDIKMNCILHVKTRPQVKRNGFETFQNLFGPLINSLKCDEAYDVAIGDSLLCVACKLKELIQKESRDLSYQRLPITFLEEHKPCFRSRVGKSKASLWGSYLLVIEVVKKCFDILLSEITKLEEGDRWRLQKTINNYITNALMNLHVYVEKRRALLLLLESNACFKVPTEYMNMHKFLKFKFLFNGAVEYLFGKIAFASMNLDNCGDTCLPHDEALAIEWINNEIKTIVEDEIKSSNLIVSIMVPNGFSSSILWNNQ